MAAAPVYFGAASVNSLEEPSILKPLRIVSIGLCTLAAACGSKSPTAPTTAGAPALASPADGAALDTFRPTLAVSNATSSQGGARTYEFQISENSGFSAIVARAAGIAEGTNGSTAFTPDFDLQTATRFYWRARYTQGSAASDWSAARNFTTPIVGYNRDGELYDPLVYGATVGEAVGSTTLIPGKGIRLNDGNAYVRYQLRQPIGGGEFSMEVEGLFNNGPGEKMKVFSMSDGTGNVFRSQYLLVAQYRGVNGNPSNCIAFKALLGDPFYKLEPDFGERDAAVMALDPNRTYFWKGTWGNFFHLVVQEGINGRTLYNFGKTITDVEGVTSPSAATYNPSPHFAYLGANNGPFGEEAGSWPGAVYRNVWISNRPRPASLGSALLPPQ